VTVSVDAVVYSRVFNPVNIAFYYYF